MNQLTTEHRERDAPILIMSSELFTHLNHFLIKRPVSTFNPSSLNHMHVN